MADPPSKGIGKEYQECPDRDEDDIIERVRKGERDAFNILFVRYYRRLFRVLFSMTGNREDAEELLQETFFKAYRGLPEFRKGANFYTWLYRIGINTVIDFRRKGKVRNIEYLDEVRAGGGIERLFKNQDSTAPDLALERRESMGRVIHALNHLSDPHKSILILREVEGLPYREIARILRCSEGTVMSRLFYARKGLKKIFLSLDKGKKP